jgi:shikimate kinase
VATPPRTGHLWLVGLMGSGKSTVGALVAERLGIPFVDTDGMVEEETAMRVPALWVIDGGVTFRRIEAAAVATVAAGTGPRVVATGGGAVLDPASVDHMRRSGLVVWLEADPAELATRVNVEGRPLLAGSPPEARLTALLEERHQLYAAVAHHRVTTGGKSVDVVCTEVVELWRAAT